MRKVVLALCLLLVATAAHAQVGSLIWEDNFNTLDNWLKVTGNGSWGWGNGELEYYRAENVDVVDTPGETGNKCVRIAIKNESGAGIVDQWGNPLNYTSGKLSSRSFVSVKYGMIETRVWVPNIRVGGWPAFWMLGTATHDWPNCGEVDLMEMGAKQSWRNLHDSHNGGNGLDNSTENNMVGANAIWYSASAVGPNNLSGAASIAYDPTDISDRPYYNYSPGLNGRFLIYRCYWDHQSMRFTVVDDGVEHDLYVSPLVFDADAQASFTQPMYFLMNCAVGGNYTDAYVLGNTGAGVPISMPMTSYMYVDYVRVYQYNGEGEVALGPPTQKLGRAGLYTDTTPCTSQMTPTVDENIYVWESTLVAGTIPAYEGTNVLSWKTNAKGWFGAGIMSTQPTNMFAMGGGTLKFRIKIPANVAFKIGITDVWSNQFYVDFPANTTKYGLVRDGNWGQASIPVEDLRGTLMDLRMLAYTFVILEVNGASCEFALDDIYWQSSSFTGVDDAHAPTAGSKLTSAPNPARGATQISFQLAAVQPYDLEVYDVTGQRVAMFRGIGHAGLNNLPWSARDERGGTLRPGVYLTRLVTGGRVENRKITLLQ